MNFIKEQSGLIKIETWTAEITIYKEKKCI